MYILFDIGGTKMRLAGSSDGKTFEKICIEDTPLQFDAALSLFKQITLSIAHGEPITALCGGVPSPLDVERNILLNPTHLPLWKGRGLKKELQEIFSAPVYIQNDAAMVGLGEATAGAGAGYGIVAYITVSTGVGGARIINGVLDESTAGFEPGHQIIDSDDSMCPVPGTCGDGDLEGYISGTSLEARYSTSPREITDMAVWDGLAKFLAIGINNIIALWSPDVVVLGGSMIVSSVGISVDKVAGELKDIFTIFPKLPDIKQATLHDEGGLHGALRYLQQNMSQAPQTSLELL